jgi:hypothetical protein
VLRRPYHGSVDRSFIERRFAREDGVVAAIEAIPGVVVAAVDLATLDFATQLRIAAETDLLIGAHGAGLAHLLCMRPAGGVLEVASEPSGSTPYMYAHMAAWRGLLWASLRCPERGRLRGTELVVEPGRLRELASRMVAEIRARAAVRIRSRDGPS